MKHDKKQKILIRKKRIKSIPNVGVLVKSEANKCIDKIIYNTNILTKKYNKNTLHQIRISLRKIKSLVYFFKIFLNKDEFSSINNIIHQLIIPTSKVRNYDIVESNYIYPAYLANNNYDEFMTHSLNEIHKLHKNTLKILSSNQHQDILIELKKQINVCNWDNCSREFSSKSAGKYIEKKINKELTSIYSSTKKCHQLPRKKLHHLRIKIKQLRYVVEILDSYLKDYKNNLEALNNFQDILGEINDTYAAQLIINDLNISKHLSSHQDQLEENILNHRNSSLEKLKEQF